VSALHPTPPSGNEALQKTPSPTATPASHAPDSPSDCGSCIGAQVTVRETVAYACDDLSTSIKKIRGAASWAPSEGLDFAERRILPRLPPSARRLVGVLGRNTAPTYVSTSPYVCVRD